MFGQGIAESLIAAWLASLLREPGWKIRLAGCRIVRPSEPMRVSFSALLRIQNGDQFLLIRNLHRPESFGPLGGVYKHHVGARAALDLLEFEQQIVGPGADMKGDLRGFLPRGNVPKLLKWYASLADREVNRECLRREISEELKEIKLSRRVPRTFSLRLVRAVREGPARVPGEGYTQFRMLEVYDFHPADTAAHRLRDWLLKTAICHKDLVCATPGEIRRGRHASGALIGSQASYLLWRRRVRSDTPMLLTDKSLSNSTFSTSPEEAAQALSLLSGKDNLGNHRVRRSRVVSPPNPEERQ